MMMLNCHSDTGILVAI